MHILPFHRRHPCLLGYASDSVVAKHDHVSPCALQATSPIGNILQYVGNATRQTKSTYESIYVCMHVSNHPSTEQKKQQGIEPTEEARQHQDLHPKWIKILTKINQKSSIILITMAWPFSGNTAAIGQPALSANCWCMSKSIKNSTKIGFLGILGPS